MTPVRRNACDIAWCRLEVDMPLARNRILNIASTFLEAYVERVKLKEITHDNQLRVAGQLEAYSGIDDEVWYRFIKAMKEDMLKFMAPEVRGPQSMIVIQFIEKNRKEPLATLRREVGNLATRFEVPIEEALEFTEIVYTAILRRELRR